MIQIEKGKLEEFIFKNSPSIGYRPSYRWFPFWIEEVEGGYIATRMDKMPDKFKDGVATAQKDGFMGPGNINDWKP